MSDKSLKRRLPIDRPCSACSGGDPEMKYHMHSPPFREGYGEAAASGDVPPQYDKATLPPAAPDGGETLEQKARKLAIDVLSNCAAHYASPEWYVTELKLGDDLTPQTFIDRAIALGTNITLAAMRDHSRQQAERIKELENRHVQFMVAGGPVVMATEFDAMKRRAESAERERDAFAKHNLEWAKAAEARMKERDEAVAQVAGLEDELRHVVVTLSHIAEMFPIGVAPEDLVTAMQNKCGALVARLKALASSAPLVATHDATVLECAANLAACCHSGGEAAVAIRKRAAELRKQAGGQ